MRFPRTFTLLAGFPVIDVAGFIAATDITWSTRSVSIFEVITQQLPIIVPILVMTYLLPSYRQMSRTGWKFGCLSYHYRMYFDC